MKLPMPTLCALASALATPALAFQLPSGQVATAIKADPALAAKYAADASKPAPSTA